MHKHLQSFVVCKTFWTRPFGPVLSLNTSSTIFMPRQNEAIQESKIFMHVTLQESRELLRRDPFRRPTKQMAQIQLTRRKAARSPSPSFKTCNRCKKNWAQRSLSTGGNPRPAASSIYSHIHFSFIAASWTTQKCPCVCLFAGGVKNTTGLLSSYLFCSQQCLIF